jgi:hypothetical protein
MQPPLLTEPPSDALPDPSSSARWYGEIWVKYPGTQHLHPSHFSYLFKAKAELRMIMGKFCTLAYSKDIMVAPETAYDLYSQLNSWSANLPGPLQARNIVFPAHLQLQ